MTTVASDAHTALVTGATAGLGAEFARQLAAAGHDVVLVARTEQRLREFAADLSVRYGVQAHVVVADLETPDGLAAVEAALASDAWQVRMLVNNAGYGLGTGFLDHDVTEELAQHAILTTAVLRLTHAAARHFNGRGGGHVVNVASVAAFVSGGTYSAAKAWVVSFSRWANANLGSVRVTAVCPGFVRTEFHDRMGVDATSLPGVAWLQADTVVRSALRAARRGRSVVVPSLRYKLVVALTKVLPPQWLVARGGLWRPRAESSR